MPADMTNTRAYTLACTEIEGRHQSACSEARAAYYAARRELLAAHNADREAVAKAFDEIKSDPSFPGYAEIRARLAELDYPPDDRALRAQLGAAIGAADNAFHAATAELRAQRLAPVVASRGAPAVAPAAPVTPAADPGATIH